MEKELKLAEMEMGKMYFISYGPVDIVGRFKELTTTEIELFDYVHFWNGYKSFHKAGNKIVKTGIQVIRSASMPEKELLFRLEIEHNCI